MPRTHISRSSLHPYHVSARCNNREWYSIPLQTVWKIYEQVFNEAQKKYGIELTAFVLMNNHFHAMISTPQSNIDKAMWYIMRQSSLKIGSQAGRINKIYGSRYHSTLVLSEMIFSKVLKYIYRNPVRAGLCNKVEKYPYSTLSRHHNFSLCSTQDSQSISRDLEYLNTPEPSEFEEAIRKSLRRSKVNRLRDMKHRNVIKVPPNFA